MFKLHLHLKPQKFRETRPQFIEARTHFSGDVGKPTTPSTHSAMHSSMASNAAGDGRILASSNYLEDSSG